MNELVGAGFQSGFSQTSPPLLYQSRLWDDTWALCHCRVFTGFLPLSSFLIPFPLSRDSRAVVGVTDDERRNFGHFILMRA